ncbi:MAG: hypothetical protein C4297_01650 [Gemmataceae bacterium]
MAERFYINAPIRLGRVALTGAEAHHIRDVCRLGVGAEVTLFNGDGAQYRAVICHSTKGQVVLEVTAREEIVRELPVHVAVAAPLPKGDRTQFLLEKLTELGVGSFIPLRTRYSIRHPAETRRDKLQRYIIEACKQCGRNRLMHLDQVRLWEDLVAQPDLPAERWLLDASGVPLAELRPSLSVVLVQPDPAILIAAGPEGGWTREEIQMARARGFFIVSLGQRILRIETAALAACAWVMVQLGK